MSTWHIKGQHIPVSDYIKDKYLVNVTRRCDAGEGKQVFALGLCDDVTDVLKDIIIDMSRKQ